MDLGESDVERGGPELVMTSLGFDAAIFTSVAKNLRESTGIW